MTVYEASIEKWHRRKKRHFWIVQTIEGAGIIPCSQWQKTKKSFNWASATFSAMTNVFHDMKTFLQDWDEAHSISSVLPIIILWLSFLQHPQKVKEFNSLNVLWKVHEHINLHPYLHTNTPPHSQSLTLPGKLHRFNFYTVEFWYKNCRFHVPHLGASYVLPKDTAK